MEKRESSFTVVGISNLSTHSGNTYSVFTDFKGQFSILIKKNKQANKQKKNSIAKTISSN